MVWSSSTWLWSNTWNSKYECSLEIEICNCPFQSFESALKLSSTCSTLENVFIELHEFSTWPMEQLFWSIYFSDDDSSNLVNSSNSKHRPEITVNLGKDNKKCLEGFQPLKFSCDSNLLPSKFNSKVQRCWFSANFSIASKSLWQSCTNLLAALHLSFSVQEPFGQSYIERFKLRLQAIMIKSSKLWREKLTAKAAIWTQSMTNEYLMLHCSFVMLDCFWYFSAISPISLLHIATTFFMTFFQSASFIAFSMKVWAASVSTSSFLTRSSFLKISCFNFC